MAMEEVGFEIGVHSSCGNGISVHIYRKSRKAGYEFVGSGYSSDSEKSQEERTQEALEEALDTENLTDAEKEFIREGMKEPEEVEVEEEEEDEDDWSDDDDEDYEDEDEEDLEEVLIEEEEPVLV